MLSIFDEINQLQQVVFILNTLKSKTKEKCLGSKQVPFCVWFPWIYHKYSLDFPNAPFRILPTEISHVQTSITHYSIMCARHFSKCTKITAVNNKTRQDFHIQVHNLLLTFCFPHTGCAYYPGGRSYI